MDKAKKPKQSLEEKFDAALKELRDEFVVGSTKEHYSAQTKASLLSMAELKQGELLELLTFLNGVKSKQASILRLDFRQDQRKINDARRQEERKVRTEYRANMKALGLKTRRRKKNTGSPKWFSPVNPLDWYNGGAKPTFLKEWAEANPDGDWKSWLLKVDPFSEHESRNAWAKKEDQTTED